MIKVILVPKLLEYTRILKETWKETKARAWLQLAKPNKPHQSIVPMWYLMSSIIEISAGSFHSEVIDVDKPVVVEFFSNSCSHCIRFRPIYEKLSETLKGQAKFVKINVPLNEENKALTHTNEGNKALAHNRGIRSLPTLEVFYQGRAIGNIVGYHPFEKVYEIIKDILSKKEKHIGPSTPFKYAHSSL